MSDSKVTLIDVIRNTNLLTDAEVASWCAAQQRQFDELGHHWDLTVSIQFVPPEHKTRPGALQHWLKDHSPEPGALGFHDDQGNPMAYTFVADARADGVRPSVTFSHENWEITVDPTINRTVRYTDAASVTWEAPVEVCDCCEDDRFAVEYEGLNGEMVPLTAITLPAWFDPAGVAPFTWPPIAQITAPFQLAEGGYIGRREIAPHVTDWQQVFAMGDRTARQKKGWWSRTVRRFTAIEHASDCAVHNGPAYPPGPCNCGAA